MSNNLNAGYLPKIKCTNCGVDIDIERMGDHLCGPGPGATTDRPLPRSFSDAFSNMSVNQSIPAPFRQKPIPRSIDSNAANAPYLHHPPKWTSSQSYNKATLLATDGRQASPLQRSATHPPRPVSPDFILPQECAFPAFPLPSKSPMSRQLDRSNTDPLRNGNVYKGSRNQEYGINSSHNHVNIQNLSNGGISDEELSTLNSFSRQSSTSGQRPMINLSGIPSRIHVQPVEVLSTSMPPTFSASGKLASLGRNKSVSAANRPLDEIGNIRRPKPVPSQNELSQSTSSSSIPKSPSAQGYRYSRTIYDNAPSVLGRSDGRIHMLPRSAIANAPLPLKQHPHDRSESRNATNHAQSDSTASNQSENSQATTSSSRSSPPTSNASLSPRRYDNQDLGNSALKYEVERERIQTGSATRSFSRPSYARPTIPILSPETFEQVTAGPWQSELKARPREAPKPLDIRAAYHINGPFRDDPPHPPAPEFPKDSALKDNSLPIVNTRIEFPLVAPDFQEATRSAMMPTTERYGIFQDTLASSPPPRPTLRRAATTSKGRCRGCSEIITGKSVSSADGRLTGRWHKQCFTCKTCAEPFPTMDFYVIGNDPYCNRHYHRLNKSLCSSCDRGIEGQYVDNDQRKFHPHCFTCSECHLILRDTYFDLNGKIFCEQHAFKLDALPSFGAAGRRYPEKRATRLMRI